MATAIVTDLEEQYECSICFQILNNPHFLTCGHNFCEGCIQKLVKDNGNHICCPECRKYTIRTEIRKDYRTCSIIEKLTGGSRRVGENKDCNVCKRSKVIKYYCKECDEFMCVACKSLHSGFKRNKDHLVKTVEEEFDDCQSQLLKYLEEFQQEINQLQTKEMEIVNEKSRVRLVQDILCSQVDEIVSTVTKTMEQYGQILQEQIRAEDRTYAQELTEHEKMLKNVITDKESLLKHILKNSTSASVCELQEMLQLLELSRKTEYVARPEFQVKKRKVCHKKVFNPSEYIDLDMKRFHPKKAYEQLFKEKKVNFPI
jgi:hypothetical protein